MRFCLLLALAAVPATALAQPPAPPTPAAPTAEESFAKGVQLHQSGDILGAIEAYQDALQQEPQRIDARSNLGAAYVRLGRYEEAVREYRRAPGGGARPAGGRVNPALPPFKTALGSGAPPELGRGPFVHPQPTAARPLLAGR